jgi:3'(2'), 5'-bisphosphate nucleotidase
MTITKEQYEKILHNFCDQTLYVKHKYHLNSYHILMPKSEDEKLGSLTSLDLEVSKFFRKFLSEVTPDIKIIDEEWKIEHNIENETYWLLDPIDGTSSLLKASPDFTINLALIINGKAELGFLGAPAYNQVIYTNFDRTSAAIGNIKEDDSISHSIFHTKPKNIRDISAIFSSRATESTYKFLDKYKIEHFTLKASAYKYALIALGDYDVAPMFVDTSQWDIAAPHAILKALSGNIIDYKTLKELEYSSSSETYLNNHFIAFNKNFSEAFVE